MNCDRQAEPAAKEDLRPELVTGLVTTDSAESRNALIRLSVIDVGALLRRPNVLSPIRSFQMLQIEIMGLTWCRFWKVEILE